ncbi:MAG: hypothetical protein GY943_25675, partial [Chloroflexi bacterium]|nr:hypothetical protein [Chloroflexota bacterium]
MFRKNVLILLILFAIFLAACGGSADYAESEAAYYDAPATEGGFAGEAEEQMAFDSDDAGFAANMDTSSTIPASEPAQQEDVTFPQERLIIRNAELSLVVANTDEAIFKITEMVESDGGWVVNSNVYQYDEDAKTG